MSIANELEQLNDIVFKLLNENAKYRDSDKMLCAKIWSMQLGGIERIKQISAYQFFCDYSSNESVLYSQESIGRCRRKLQEENPQLRGKKYNHRQNETKPVQMALGYNSY